MARSTGFVGYVFGILKDGDYEEMASVLMGEESDILEGGYAVDDFSYSNKKNKKCNNLEELDALLKTLDKAEEKPNALLEQGLEFSPAGCFSEALTVFKGIMNASKEILQDCSCGISKTLNAYFLVVGIENSKTIEDLLSVVEELKYVLVV